LLERNVSVDEAKLFDQYQTLCEFVQKSISQMQVIIKRWNMKDGQNILQFAIPLNALAN